MDKELKYSKQKLKIFNILFAIAPIVMIFLTIISVFLIDYFAFQNYFSKEKETIKKEFFDHLKIITKQRVDTALKVLNEVYNIKIKDEKEKLKEILDIYISKKINNPNIHIKISDTPLKFNNNYIVVSKKVGNKYFYIYEPLEVVKKEIKKEIPCLFDSFRWGKSGYIFVHDTKGVCYYHINKSLIGKNRWNLKRGSVYILQKLTKEALKHPKGAYVTYLAYNPEGKKPLLKTSYIVYDKVLGLTIGSGIYLKNLNKRLKIIENKKQQIIYNLLKYLIILSLIVFIVFSFFIYFALCFLEKRIEKYEMKIDEFEEKQCKDETTGILKKECIKEMFEKIKNKKLAIIDINVNDFKGLNSIYGIQKGNKILKILGEKIKRSIKHSDILIKGKIDEFIIIAPYKEKRNISALVQRLYKILTKPFSIDGKNILIPIRIGIALNEENNNLDDLINNASSIGYTAKNKEIKIAFYDKKYENDIKQYLEIKNDLMNLISKKDFSEFEIYYQPQIDKNEKLVGMEALIRWNHPKKGFISPGVFLPIAINEGLIKKLDLWTIESVIIQINKWLDKGFNPGVVSCNVTMQQLESRDFMNKLKELIKKHNFTDKLKYLGIEVTEESIMNNSTKVIKTLKEIKNLGITISLDDFGTGYSNLTKLKQFPIDKLKIDKSFIDGIPENKNDVALTKIVIEIGKILNYKLIAEGVENKVQKDFVFENGVDYIQGYYYSKPLPPNEVEKRVEEIQNGKI